MCHVWGAGAGGEGGAGGGPARSAPARAARLASRHHSPLATRRALVLAHNALASRPRRTYDTISASPAFVCCAVLPITDFTIPSDVDVGL